MDDEPLAPWSSSSSSGRLVLAATPIGDPGDAPARLAALLAEADVVAAEDTRRLRRLAAALGVTVRGRVVSYHEHNETARSPQLVAQAAAGATVVLVTDAGMPSVSDPGLRAVRAALDAGVPVTVVPGASAVLTALALSGLATDRFCFEGFLPRGAGERARALASLAGEPRTMVFFESRHRVAGTLDAMAAVFGTDRPAALCRELTKTHETVVRRPLGELVTWARTDPPLGEITLVVAGRPPADPVAAADLAALVPLVAEYRSNGLRLKDAVAAVADLHGASKRELYQAVVTAPPSSDRTNPPGR